MTEPREADPIPCVCCGAEHFCPHYRIGGHLLVRCRNCSLIRQARLPTPEALVGLYSSERYFHNPEFLSGSPETLYGYQDAAADTELKYRLYERLLRPVVRESFPSPQGVSWLDVGSGLGSLVDFARKEGCDGVGIEPNPAAIQKARETFGDHFLPGSTETVRLDRSFDVITLIDVVEHLLDPEGCLRWVRCHLTERGIAIVVTMDCRSVVSRLLGSRLEDFRRVSEHVYFFSRSNFPFLAERCGLRAVRTRSWGGYFNGRDLFQRACAMCGIPPAISGWVGGLLLPPRLTVYVDPRVKMMVMLRKTS